MITACIPFLVAMLCAWALTPVARRVACGLKIVDAPDGARKLQKKPVPLLGGVAVNAAVLLGLISAVLVAPADDGSLLNLATVLGLSTCMMCVFGGLDDCWHLRPRAKLALQTAATMPIMSEGYYIDCVSLCGTQIELGWLGAPLTLLWLLTCMNAMNLIDGMDGLAAVITASFSVAVAVIAGLMGAPHVAMISMAVAGAVLGFLAHNFPPASIYLGDSGSTALGLSIGVLAMTGLTPGGNAPSIAIPAAILTIPLLDISLAVVRRRLSGVRVCAGDRKHVHHCLLDHGLRVRSALAVVSALCIATGAGAVLATMLRSDGIAILAALGAVIVLSRVGQVGVYELALIRLAAARACLAAGSFLLGSLRLQGLVVHSKGEWQNWPAANEAGPTGQSLAAASRSLPVQTEQVQETSEEEGAWTLFAQFKDTQEHLSELHVHGRASRPVAAQLLLRLASELTKDSDADAPLPTILSLPGASSPASRPANSRRPAA